MGKQGPQVLCHEYEKRTFPSTIAAKDGVWTVGKYSVTDYPPGAQFLHDVKRILGRDIKDRQLQAHIKQWDLGFGFESDGSISREINGEVVRPREITALLILRAKYIVEKNTGKKVNECVITVPAYFTDAQRRATLDAASIAEVRVIRILNEPTAVAVSHLWDTETTGDFLVVDAGGGTFDCSRLNLSISHGKQTIIVRQTGGDNALGGNDFTRTLARLFAKKAVDIPFDELLTLCEAAKKQSGENIVIRPRGQPHTIPRSEYKEALQEDFRKMRQVIKEVLQGGDVDFVICAGGACCQKEVQELVQEMVPKTKQVHLRPAPSEAVAEGAAIMTDANRIVVTDILSRSLGIEVQNRNGRGKPQMEPILKKHSQLPISYTRNFIGRHETETEILTLEGEEKEASKNNELNKYMFGVRKGELFKVQFAATRDSEIKVKAFTNVDSKSITIKRGRSELTEDELKDTRRKVLGWFATDREMCEDNQSQMGKTGSEICEDNQSQTGKGRRRRKKRRRLV